MFKKFNRLQCFLDNKGLGFFVKEQKKHEKQAIAESSEKNSGLEKALQEREKGESEIGKLQIAELKETLQGKEKEIVELKQDLQRVQAEFENFKKRVEKERQEFAKYCNAGILVELLPLLESIEKCLAGLESEKDRQGMQAIERQFKQLLERHKVKEMENAVGKKFNPELQDAVMQGFEQGKNERIVLEELQKGYFIGSKVLRHAKVKVNKKPVEELRKQEKEKTIEEKTGAKAMEMKEEKVMG